MQVRCYKCGHPVALPEQTATLGGTFPCPSCGQLNTVAARGSSAVSHKDNRLRNVIIGFFVLLALAGGVPWLGLLLGLGFVTWGVLAAVKKKPSLLALIYSESPRSTTLAALTIGGGILITLFAVLSLSNSLEKQRREARQRQKVAARQERERQEVRAQEERLRSEAATMAQKWSANLDEVAALERSGKVRDAYARHREAQVAVQSHLALVPLPEPLAALIPKQQELETRLKPIVELLDTYEQAQATQKRAAQLIKEKEWIAADATLADVLTLVAKIEASPPETQKHLPGNYAAVRHRADVEKTRQKIKGQVAQAKQKEAEQQAYRVLCGDKPVCGGWDGECIGIESALKRVAHDPDSIDVENCTDPVLMDKRCWVTTCDVRGKNMFGALILQRKRFSLSKLGVEEF